jgi:hypothetical protein
MATHATPHWTRSEFHLQIGHIQYVSTLLMADRKFEPSPHILHVVNSKCEPQVRDLLGGRGEGGLICETVPFVNRSSDQLQTQNQDSQYYFASLLLRQDLSISYWWLLANFGQFI